MAAKSGAWMCLLCNPYLCATSSHLGPTLKDEEPGHGSCRLSFAFCRTQPELEDRPTLECFLGPSGAIGVFRAIMSVYCIKNRRQVGSLVIRGRAGYCTPCAAGMITDQRT